MTTTLVTTTRNRAECFNLLELWMKRQTRKFDQWVVVNDGTGDYHYSMYQDVIQRDPTNDERPSIVENWLAALPAIDGDRVIVVEDDDWYAPNYLETVLAMLDEVQLAGVSHDVYYKLPTNRFMRMGNENHASLAASGFRYEIIDQYERVCSLLCRQSVFIDMYLWAEAGVVWPCTKRLLRQSFNGPMLHVGMKNMPGAPGLGVGHLNPTSGSHDPTYSILKEWVGSHDAMVYKNFREEFCS